MLSLLNKKVQSVFILKKYNAKRLRQPEQQKINIYGRSNWQNNNFICLEAHFSVHFFAVVVAREQRETSYLHVLKRN